MRIVGGRLKGRPLRGPRSDRIRPTTDRMRESLFNILAHGYPDALEGARILDCFAGTGALGLEAISRGASSVLFVEDHPEARAIIRENIETFDLTGVARIFRRDATRLGPVGTMAPFGVLFADPPYGKGLGERALESAAKGGWLVPGALCILEESVDAEVTLPAAFSLIETRQAGQSTIRIARFVGAALNGA